MTDAAEPSRPAAGEPWVTSNGCVGQVDATRVPRYAGEPTFARLPRLADLPGDADVSILAVPFDTGVSYRLGARLGSGHIRESSRLLRPYNPAAGSRRSRPTGGRRGRPRRQHHRHRDDHTADLTKTRMYGKNT